MTCVNSNKQMAADLVWHLYKYVYVVKHPNSIVNITTLLNV